MTDRPGGRGRREPTPRNQKTAAAAQSRTRTNAARILASTHSCLRCRCRFNAGVIPGPGPSVPEMAKLPGIRSVGARPAEISAGSGLLEAPDAIADLERFRLILQRVGGKPRGARNGRPALDAVPARTAPTLQSRRGRPLEASGVPVRALAGPDAILRPGIATRRRMRTCFGIAATRRSMLDGCRVRGAVLMINAAGRIARARGIVDSTLVPLSAGAPAPGKAAIKRGERPRSSGPAGCRSGADERRTFRSAKARTQPKGAKRAEMLPVFDCNSCIGMGRRTGIIRRRGVADPSVRYGARLLEGLIETTMPGAGRVG